jgi:hypothetical protein
VSWKALKALLEAPPCWSTPAQFGVLVCIANSMNERGDERRGIPPGYAWPSKARIAGTIGVSARYVPEVVRELESAGLLQVLKGRGPRGLNLYRLTLPTSAVEFIPAEAATSAVEFIPPRDDHACGVNSEAATDELSSKGDELHGTRGVLSSSSDPYRDPCIHPERDPRTAAPPPSRLLTVDEKQQVQAVAKRLLGSKPYAEYEDLVDDIRSEMGDDAPTKDQLQLGPAFREFLMDRTARRDAKRLEDASEGQRARQGGVR